MGITSPQTSPLQKAVLALALGALGIGWPAFSVEGGGKKAGAGITPKAGVAVAGGDVLLIAGTPGSPVYARRYQDWLNRFRAVFLRAGISADRILTLQVPFTPEGDGAAAAKPQEAATATAAGIGAAFTTIAQRIAPNERLYVVMIGHGVNGEKPPTFVTPGEQPTAEALAKWLNAVPTPHQVVLNFSASSGVFLSYLAKQGRINISALAPMEGSEPVLAEFFLRGIESGRADENRDKIVTLLEAYNWSAWAVAQWTNRQLQMGTFVVRGMKEVFVPRGDWRMDGRETVEIFRKLCDGDEGEPGVRKLAPESRIDVPDMTVEIRPRGGILTKEWRQRRILGEHAMLEDCGNPPGVTPFLPWTPRPEAPAVAAEATLDGGVVLTGMTAEDRGFEPVRGEQPGGPGALARTVILSAPPLARGP